MKKVHRFITDCKIYNGEVLVEEPEVVKQIKSVLKLNVGEQVIVGDGLMNEVLGEIGQINRDKIVLKIVRQYQNENEPNNSVVLYCSVLKKENFETIVQKATEIGVKEIVPLICKRTVKLSLNMDRLRKIIKEAAEQSGRGIVPVLHEPLEFEDALLEAKGQTNLFFDMSGKKLNPKSSHPINVWIGPEGGWDEQELALAKEHDFDIVSLGKLMLRGETAAIVACHSCVEF